MTKNVRANLLAFAVVKRVTWRSLHVLTTQDQYDNKLAEACATRLCSHTFNVGLIFEPREGRIVTS